MKKIITKFLKALVVVLMVSFAYSAEAQPPADPPGGSSGIGNSSGNSQGGNAPIGGGLFLLLGLGAAYGGRKIYIAQKEQLEE